MEPGAVWMPVETAATRSSNVRARWAMILVGVATFALIGAVGTVYQGVSVIDRLPFVSQSEIASWEKALRSAVGAYAICYVLAGIAFLAWLSRVVDNVPSLGGGRPNASPRAAIGWWFVPFVNLVKPFQVVADVWRRLATTPQERATTLLLVWWLLWLGGGIVDRIIGAVPDPDDLATLRSLLVLDSIALFAQVIAGWLLIRAIWEIERRSRIREEALRGGLLAGRAIAAPSPGAAATDATQVLAFCVRCGAGRLKGARYCGTCGTDFEALTPAPSPAVPQ